MVRVRQPKPPSGCSLLVGELAAALGVTPKTLRHYEKLGVVPPAGRGANGYRRYPADSIRRARLAVKLRALGFTLPAVRALLAAADAKAMRARLSSELDQKIQETALQIAVLQGRRDEMEARLLAIFDAPAGADAAAVCDAFLGAAPQGAVGKDRLTLP
jgi:DNA-binding transcriptional MerR regulator